MSRLDNLPCKPDCPDRSANPNCHGYCEKYLKWLDEQKEKKEALKSYKIANNMHESKFIKNQADKFVKNDLKKWR